MAEEWFYAQQGRQLGPVPIDTLTAMLRNGQVAPTDLVWRQGMPNWAEARAIPELAPPQTPTTPASAFVPVAPLIDSPQSQSGFQQVQYQNPRGMQWDYAGFWLRFCAWIIDWILLAIAGSFISVATGHAMSMAVFHHGMRHPLFYTLAGSQNLLNIVIWWLYYALLESSVHRATLGKMALGLIVTDELGNRLTFGRATGRTFAKYISYIAFGIGYILCGFTDRRQCLHDMIARCLVMRKDVNRR